MRMALSKSLTRKGCENYWVTGEDEILGMTGLIVMFPNYSGKCKKRIRESAFCPDGKYRLF